jgi:lysyl-tRNA synthetase class I
MLNRLPKNAMILNNMERKTVRTKYCTVSPFLCTKKHYISSVHETTLKNNLKCMQYIQHIEHKVAANYLPKGKLPGDPALENLSPGLEVSSAYYWR